jgi:hypothetical protein
MFPYYAPFMTPEKANDIRSGMIGSEDKSLFQRSGLGTSEFGGWQRFFQFCPVCCSEERSRNGETYWHRLSQLPGISVCPAHKVFLESSEACVSSGRTSGDFMPAEEAIPIIKPRHLDPCDESHAILLRLAQDAAWLGKFLVTGDVLASLQQQYMRQAIRVDIATTTGTLLLRKLLSDIKKRYSNEFLSSVFSNVSYENKTRITNPWIATAMRSRVKVQAPIRHLILMDYFDLPPSTALSTGQNQTVFGPPPWKCTNPVCLKCNQAVIQKYKLEYTGMYGHMTGIFTCPECEQQTARTISGGVEKTRVVKYGPLWTAALARLWSDSSVGLKSIEIALGVKKECILRMATEQSLPFPRACKYGKQLNIAPKVNVKRKEERKSKISERRKEWLALRDAHPDDSIMELAAHSPSCYSYLNRLDHEWFVKNRPAPRPIPPNGFRVDWDQRDQQYYGEVTTTIDALRKIDGIPQRIMLKSIAKLLSKLAITHQMLQKLPKTWAVFRFEAETNVRYACRKITWAASCFRKEGTVVVKKDLIARAQLTRANMVHDEVKAALEQELTRSPSGHFEIISDLAA